MLKNNNKYFLLAVLLLALNLESVFAFWSQDTDNEKIVNGSTKLRNKKYDSDLTINGSLKFSDLSAKNVIINGSADGTNLSCEDLVVNGKSKLKNISINNGELNGRATVDKLSVEEDLKGNGGFTGTNIEVNGVAELTGNIKIKNSRLNNIEVTSNKPFFYNTKINNIRITEKNDRLYLTNGSIVSGNVTFESEKGKVFLDDSSKINGKIKGGKIADEKDKLDF